MPETYILTLSCEDQSGIVAAISNALLKHECFITRSRSFGDPATRTFFMRLAFRPESSGFQIEALKDDLVSIGTKLNADWQIYDEAHKLKTLIMVSRLDHCANALLYGARTGELPIEPVGILSNHPDLASERQHWGLPFHTVPVSADTKAEAERAMFDVIDSSGAELVVLARYMQILTDGACRALTGKCINIHHSFLPSFKGARPYHRAHERGVKMIGATAHYVTADLDEGPLEVALRDRRRRGRGRGGRTPCFRPARTSSRIFSSPCRAASRGLETSPELRALARLPSDIPP